MSWLLPADSHMWIMLLLYFRCSYLILEFHTYLHIYIFKYTYIYMPLWSECSYLHTQIHTYTCIHTYICFVFPFSPLVKISAKSVFLWANLILILLFIFLVACFFFERTVTFKRAYMYCSMSMGRDVRGAGLHAPSDTRKADSRDGPQCSLCKR